MGPHSPQTVADLIGEEIATGMRSLPFSLRCWAQSHVVPPRLIVLSLDPRGQTQDTFWLVTDHTGSDDAPCRVVFDGSGFGLAVMLPNGIECYAGRIGSFAAAVENI